LPEERETWHGVGMFALVLLACVGGAALVGGYVWRSVKDDLHNPLDELVADTDRFAAEHEQADCTPEALRRLRDCEWVWCRVKTPLFTSQCLEKARRSEHLCDGVPGTSSPKVSDWFEQRCKKDEDEPFCWQIYQVVVIECSKAEAGQHRASSE